ncbi:hypothetical protein An04g05010 [Aspergillus niger]|uniref:Uncharacterized protein n=2 Tax=Aspergillus niger TaxID=5061 RepID=A2QIW9_ASPNC|nr:hypothetical protein An04g05010 [Aspergillus niger]CAK38763.1 hypothetical protein An04g05010 [Aspergillus niger]
MTAPPGRPAPKTLLDRPVNESPKLTAGRITGNAGVTPGLAPCSPGWGGKLTNGGGGEGEEWTGGRNERNNKSARDGQWIDKTRDLPGQLAWQLTNGKGGEKHPGSRVWRTKESIHAIRTGLACNQSVDDDVDDDVDQLTASSINLRQQLPLALGKGIPGTWSVVHPPRHMVSRARPRLGRGLLSPTRDWGNRTGVRWSGGEGEMKSSSLNSLSIGSCWLPRPVSSTYPALGEDCRSGASLASLAPCLSHAASFLPSFNSSAVIITIINVVHLGTTLDLARSLVLSNIPSPPLIAHCCPSASGQGNNHPSSSRQCLILLKEGATWMTRSSSRGQLGANTGRVDVGKKFQLITSQKFAGGLAELRFVQPFLVSRRCFSGPIRTILRFPI